MSLIIFPDRSAIFTDDAINRRMTDVVEFEFILKAPFEEELECFILSITKTAFRLDKLPVDY